MSISLRTAASAVFLVAISCTDSEGGADAEQPSNTELRQELLAMAEADQALREDLSPERMQDTTFLMEMLSSQERHASRLNEILDEYG